MAGDTHIVKVFLSHKHQDAKIAESFSEKLKLWSAGRLEIFLSEQIPGGEDWLQWIEDKLKDADLLFLLFTEPNQNWDWCLFEAGIFKGRMGGDRNRIVMICRDENNPPSQLQRLQFVEASEPKMKVFLKQFFGTSKITKIDPPLNTEFANNPKAVSQLAQEICGLFAAPSGPPEKYTHEIAVCIKDPHKIKDGKLPEDAYVRSDAQTLKIFNLSSKPPRKKHWTWMDLRAHFKSREEQKWLDEMSKIIQLSSTGKNFIPTQYSFQEIHSTRFYRPILYRREDMLDGGMKFRILFVEQVSTGITRGPDELSTLLSCINLGNRMHWEVYERFVRELRRWDTDTDVREGCAQIANAIKNIEMEAEFRREAELQKSINEDRLIWAFDDPNAKDEIDKNLEKQRQIKANFIEGRVTDKEEAEQQLSGLRDLNNQLMRMISERWNTLITTKYFN